MNVSVVIPYRNEDRDIVDRARQSALDANADHVVQVNDGETIRLAASDMPSIILNHVEDWFHISTLHAGVCHARNLGIFYAKHDLIVPLDADDELLPDGLQHLVDAWEPGTLVYGNWLEGDELKIAPPPEMLRRKHVAHATWLFHKDDWAKVGGYDPDMNLGGEDWAFMCALVGAGVKPVHVNAPIYRRTVRAGSRTDQTRNRIDFIKQLLREKYPKVMHGS